MMSMHPHTLGLLILLCIVFVAEAHSYARIARCRKDVSRAAKVAHGLKR